MRGVGGFLSVVLALVLVGCGGPDESGAGSREGAPASTAPASPSSTPYALTEATAARAIRAVKAPPGFGAPSRCPGAKGCTPPEKAMEWGRSTKFDGPRIPGGNGFRSFLYAFVTQYESPARATTVAKGITRQEQKYDGTFTQPLEPGEGDRYLPGEKGRGTVTELNQDGWSGIYRDARFTYSFRDHPDSGPVHGERVLLTRGPWLITLYSMRPGAVPRTLPGVLDDLLPALGS